MPYKYLGENMWKWLENLFTEEFVHSRQLGLPKYVVKKTPHTIDLHEQLNTVYTVSGKKYECTLKQNLFVKSENIKGSDKDHRDGFYHLDHTKMYVNYSDTGETILRFWDSSRLIFKDDKSGDTITLPIQQVKRIVSSAPVKYDTFSWVQEQVVENK